MLVGVLHSSTGKAAADAAEAIYNLSEEDDGTSWLAWRDAMRVANQDALREAGVCEHDWTFEDGVADVRAGDDAAAHAASAWFARARLLSAPVAPVCRNGSAAIARYVASAVLPHGEPKLARGGADWLLSRLAARAAVTVINGGLHEHDEKR